MTIAVLRVIVISIFSQLLPYSSLLLLILYNLWALTNIGLLYDQSGLSWPSEAARCLTTLILFTNLSPVFSVSSSVLQLIFLSSACVSLLMSGYGLARPSLKQQ